MRLLITLVDFRSLHYLLAILYKFSTDYSIIALHWLHAYIFICQIGSYPGFEDGEFESVKLARPAASFYHSAQNCLYFVDSEVCSSSSQYLYLNFQIHVRLLMCLDVLIHFNRFSSQ